MGLVPQLTFSSLAICLLTSWCVYLGVSEAAMVSTTVQPDVHTTGRETILVMEGN